MVTSFDPDGFQITRPSANLGGSSASSDKGEGQRPGLIWERVKAAVMNQMANPNILGGTLVDSASQQLDPI